MQASQERMLQLLQVGSHLPGKCGIWDTEMGRAYVRRASLSDCELHVQYQIYS